MRSNLAEASSAIRHGVRSLRWVTSTGRLDWLGWLGWEATHFGWNTNLQFDDSNAEGWQDAIHNGHQFSPDAIWADGDSHDGSTPVYFRKVFTLSDTPTQALLDLAIDDDAQVYINGPWLLMIKIFFRTADVRTDIAVLTYLASGAILLAIKGHDSYGFQEFLVCESEGPIQFHGFSGANTASYTPLDNGSVVVKGRIRDKDNGVTEYTATVTVNNAAPVVEAGAGSDDR